MQGYLATCIVALYCSASHFVIQGLVDLNHISVIRQRINLLCYLPLSGRQDLNLHLSPCLYALVLVLVALQHDIAASQSSIRTGTSQTIWDALPIAFTIPPRPERSPVRGYNPRKTLSISLQQSTAISILSLSPEWVSPCLISSICLCTLLISSLKCAICLSVILSSLSISFSNKVKKLAA